MRSNISGSRPIDGYGNYNENEKTTTFQMLVFKKSVVWHILRVKLLAVLVEAVDVMAKRFGLEYGPGR